MRIKVDVLRSGCCQQIDYICEKNSPTLLNLARITAQLEAQNSVLTNWVETIMLMVACFSGARGSPFALAYLTGALGPEPLRLTRKRGLGFQPITSSTRNPAEALKHAPHGDDEGGACLPW